MSVWDLRPQIQILRSSARRSWHSDFMGDQSQDVAAHAVDGAEAALRPEVDKPRPRVRIGLVVALLVAIAMGIATLLYQLAAQRSSPATAAPQLGAAHCTPLDAEQKIRTMADDERVTCLAVAGKVDRARTILRSMPEADRGRAISAVFQVAHPIADSGDDQSAGPIMALVAEFWPDNYMAVFHAGMAEFALGRDDAARIQLQRFLTMYRADDVWRNRAIRALAAIDAHEPLDRREAHFPE